MATMSLKRKTQESLRIKLLKVNAKRAKIAMESASNSIQDLKTNEEEAEDTNDKCWVEALDLSPPLDSITQTQTSTDSDPSNPSSPTLSSTEQQDQLEQESNSQVQNQTQSNPQPITGNFVAACPESEKERLSPPSPFLFEPLEPPNSPMPFVPPDSPEPDQRSNSPDPIESCYSPEPEPDQRSNSPDPIEPCYSPEPDEKSNSLDFIEPCYSPEPDERSNSPDPIEPCYSPEPDQRSNSPDSNEPCYSPDPHRTCSSPDPIEPIYDSVPSPPHQVQTERELNSEQEPAPAQPNTHQWLEHEDLFPSQQNRRKYSTNELQQSAESLPLQRVQELQALGNILFLVGRSMSSLSSLYDLLLKPGVDFQRDADTRLIFYRRAESIVLNLSSANNIMHGIDFSNCFEKK